MYPRCWATPVHANQRFSGGLVIIWRKDGSSFNCEYTSTPIGEKNNPTGVVVTFRDITERKHAEDALKESEQNLNAAQALADMGSWKLDTETMVVVWSEELVKMFDFSGKKATLESFAEIVHPDDMEYYVCHFRQGVEHGTPWDIEHRLLLGDGTIRCVHSIGEANKDKNGKIISLSGITQDVTDYKKTESELRKLSRAVEESPVSRISRMGNKAPSL